MFFPLTPCSYALAVLLFRNVVFPVCLLDLDVQFAAAFGDVVRLNPQGTDVHGGEGADFAAAVAGLISHSGVGDFAEHGVFGFQAVALGQCRQHGGAVGEGHVVVGAVDGDDKTGQRRRTAAVVGEQVLRVFGRRFAFLVLGVLLQAGAELRQFALQVGAFDKGLGRIGQNGG